MRDRADLESIHTYSSKNRQLLGKSVLAGCFYCCNTFSPSEIQDWVDGKQVETGELDDGITALCPRCGIDSVLPEGIPFHLDGALLAEMHEYFF
jgi:hypothetical protein